MDSKDLWPQRVEHWAASTPDAPWIDVIGGPVVSYAEGLEEGLRWADALARRGVGAGDHVAVLIPNTLDFVWAWLGLSWLRAVEVPVNTAYQGRMLQYILHQSDARLLMTTRSALPRLEAVADELPNLEAIILVDADDGEHSLSIPVVGRTEFLDGATPAPRPGPDPWDTATILYTSGTTGPSKGVIIPWGLHRSFGTVHELYGDVTSDDGHYVPVPLFHVGGKYPVMAMTSLGGRIILREVFSTTEFWDDVRKHRATIMTFIGVIQHFVWNQPRRPDDADNPLRISIAAPCPPNVEEFNERFGVRTVTGFGMTEMPAPLSSDGAGVDANTYATVGKVRPGFECRIVNEHDQPVPQGTTGELIVRSIKPWVMNQGYYKMPEVSFRAWRNGWFHTGDAFRSDEDGNYFFVDRMKDAIRRRGENISSSEVEADVCRHPEVERCAAFPVPSTMGDGAEDEVMISVVRVEGSTLTEAALIEWLIPRMAHFMVPRYVDLVSELPMTPTVKVRKHVLKERGVTRSTWDREAAGIVVKRAR
jgi:crotonobetaine/carnitine-CoA ligase